MRSLLIILIFSTPFYLEANLGALFRGTLKGESKVLSIAAKKSYYNFFAFYRNKRYISSLILESETKTKQL
jgi:hypothetical protein